MSNPPLTVGSVWKRALGQQLSSFLWFLHDSEHCSDVCVEVCVQGKCVCWLHVCSCTHMDSTLQSLSGVVEVGSLWGEPSYLITTTRRNYSHSKPARQKHQEKLIKTSWPAFQILWILDEHLCNLCDKQAPTGLCLCSGFIYLQNVTEESTLKPVKTHSAHCVTQSLLAVIFQLG